MRGGFLFGLFGNRTALDGKPTATGDVFVSAHTRKVVSLDGLRISAVKGPGALDGDMPLPLGIFWASHARALLESARPSRSVSGAARGMRPEELETWLERFLQIEGADRLNQLRDDMRRLALATSDSAPLPVAKDEFQRLDSMVGTLLGTRHVAMSARVAKARFAHIPFDAARVDLIAALHERLAGMLLPAPLAPGAPPDISRSLMPTSRTTSKAPSSMWARRAKWCSPERSSRDARTTLTTSWEPLNW